ncbi:MAG: LCP family protein [Candidatus Dojkabacteria bacterium]|nr:LCP family protein [Candidatus Dojkabacteria bacterium]
MKSITLDLQRNNLDKDRRRSPGAPSPFSLTHKSSPLSVSSTAGPTDGTKKRRTIKLAVKVILAFLLFTCIGGTFFLYKTGRFFQNIGINTNPIDTIGNIIQQKQPELIKDENGRTNVLLVGKDTRPSNAGLQNTDSIIVASYNHATNEVVMISIPRDTWVAYPDNPYYFTKINAIYHHCESQETGTGLSCLAQSATEITGLEIHYSGMVDISGLVEVIDLLGGVDVEVENSFTDYMFPSNDDTWETVHFDAGLQHMDGETAMKFARSRHAQSSEGSDFARARRQQRLLIAIKNKLLSTDTFTNPMAVTEVIQQLGSSVFISEITTEDIRAVIALSEKAKKTKSYSLVLDPSIANWSLITEDPSAAYVLVPKAGAGEWDDVHTFLSQFYENPALYSEKATIYVYNAGLGYNETYLKYQELTQEYPYLTFTFAGSSSNQTISGVQVYNFSEDAPAATLSELADYFETEWNSNPPEGVINAYGEDVVLVFGIPLPKTTDPTQVQ